MAELATLPENHSKLDPGTTLVTDDIVQHLEQQIDNVTSRFESPTEFTSQAKPKFRRDLIERE